MSKKANNKKPTTGNPGAKKTVTKKAATKSPVRKRAKKKYSKGRNLQNGFLNGNYTKEQIIKAIKKHDGMLATIAEAMGVTKRAVSYWRDKDDDIREAFEQAREINIDNAANWLNTEIRRDGQHAITAAVFLCKTIGRSRGYVEKTEMQIEPATIEIDGEDEL